MRWPHVESDDDWSFASIYYGTDPPGGDSDKVDVGSRRYAMSEVLRDIAVLGGDTADIINTTLLFASASVCREMRLSVTVEPITGLAERSGTEFTDEFALALVERAAATMTGAALVGALRAIAYAGSFRRPRPLRARISQRARDEVRRAGMVSGHASLVADDAHAHLWTAQNLVPPADEPRRTDVVQAQRLFAERGAWFLAAAFALAQLEPWNPFVRHRLFAELEEHRPAADLLPAEHRRPWQFVERAADQLDARWATATDAWRALVEEHNRHDIEAYFWTRRDAPPAPALTELPPETAALCEQEADWKRFL